MSADGGSASVNINRDTEKHAKWMIRAWFAITVIAFLFIDLGGRI
jgi:hypothetical protein